MRALQRNGLEVAGPSVAVRKLLRQNSKKVWNAFAGVLYPRSSLNRITALLREFRDLRAAQGASRR